MAWLCCTATVLESGGNFLEILASAHILTQRLNLRKAEFIVQKMCFDCFEVSLSNQRFGLKIFGLPKAHTLLSKRRPIVSESIKQTRWHKIEKGTTPGPIAQPPILCRQYSSSLRLGGDISI
jgi:hypothetical protein